ncbi:MAG TPA: hypothetical protein VEK08_05470 [Planctomycetota bacterium]|nr:hypothetical protein [Planctomycetota bacterium]
MTLLKDAGIDHFANGLVVDFHALRHTFITLVSCFNHNPKVTQDLARIPTST